MPQACMHCLSVEDEIYKAWIQCIVAVITRAIVDVSVDEFEYRGIE